MMKWYNANQTGGVPGNLPDPYYWVPILKAHPRFIHG